MGIIICTSCDHTIEHVENNKVATFYSKCPKCAKNKKHR